MTYLNRFFGFLFLGVLIANLSSCALVNEVKIAPSLKKLKTGEVLVVEFDPSNYLKKGSIKFTPETVQILDGIPIALIESEKDGFDVYMQEVFTNKRYKNCFYDNLIGYKVKQFRHDRLIKKWSFGTNVNSCFPNSMISAGMNIQPFNDRNTPFWREFGWRLPVDERDTTE